MICVTIFHYIRLVTSELLDTLQIPKLDGIPVTKIGVVGGDSILICEDEEILFDQPLDEVEAVWSRRLWDIMG